MLLACDSVKVRDSKARLKGEVLPSCCKGQPGVTHHLLGDFFSIRSALKNKGTLTQAPLSPSLSSTPLPSGRGTLRRDSPVSVRMDMTTKMAAAGAAESSGGSGAGAGGFDTARGSGRLRDFNSSRNGRDRKTKDGRETKARDRDLRNGKGGYKSGGGRDGDSGRRDKERADDEEEEAEEKEEEAPPYREWLDVVHHKVTHQQEMNWYRKARRKAPADYKWRPSRSSSTIIACRPVHLEGAESPAVATAAAFFLAVPLFTANLSRPIPH